MTSEGRVCLGLADGMDILGAATRKARAPKERLCRGTESKWLAV